ncbi:MAG: hypothetical protein JSR80_01225 [Verrucomicrobia bacterium]|nr:hypothetical protein [Verrucomicrobiota bacterium]
MNENELKSVIAQLESRVDYLEAEFAHLDQMLRKFGFDEGIKTLAETLNEAMQIEQLFRRDTSK